LKYPSTNRGGEREASGGASIDGIQEGGDQGVCTYIAREFEKSI
tara:strand:- start:21 stop:152 length:132 start_codon:yes stop_codon:yes gene_type:complete